MVCSVASFRAAIRSNLLLILTLLAVLCGVVLGLCVRAADPGYDTLVWIRIWGELFIRMLMCLVLPIVMSCLIVGVTSLEATAGSKLGAVTISYILSTNILPTFIGIIICIIMKPGLNFGDVRVVDIQDTSYTNLFSDFLRNLFPDNIIRACTHHAYTETYVETSSVLENGTIHNATAISRILLQRSGMNTLGIIMFSLCLGFAMSASGREAEPLVNVFKALDRVIFRFMIAVMWYSPIGIISLTASTLLEIPDLGAVLSSLAMFIATNAVASAIHLFLFVPIMYVIIVRKNPLTFYYAILDGVFAGVAPSTCIASLPLFIRSATEKLHLDDRIAKFYFPISISINRDGSAIFVACGVVFMAQTYGISLSGGQYILIGVLSGILSTTIPAVPSTAIVLLVTVSSAVGVPVAGRLSILFAVDWLLDRLRTANNCVSIGFGCGIVAHLCRNMLPPKSCCDEDTIIEKKELDTDVNIEEEMEGLNISQSCSNDV